MGDDSSKKKVLEQANMELSLLVSHLEESSSPSSVPVRLTEAFRTGISLFTARGRAGGKELGNLDFSSD